MILLGEKEAKTPNEGEVFYKDENGAICRRWNWKEADRTKITPSTRNAFLVLEILPPVDQKLLEAATNELASLIQKYCGGTVTIAFLDEQNPTITLKKDNHFVEQNPFKKIELDESPYKIATAKVAVTPEVKQSDDSPEHHVRLEKLRQWKLQASTHGRRQKRLAQRVLRCTKNIADDLS